MYCNLTPEICSVINATADEIFVKVGIWGLCVFVLAVFLIYVAIQRFLAKKFEAYKFELEKNTIKNIELWKEQKKLMFEFVEFLDDAFANQNLEIKSFMKKLNIFYGKLYLIMETHILEKLHQCLRIDGGMLSIIQRYYLYKELRIQLMQIIHTDFDNKDCPYIGLPPGRAKIPDNKTQRPANNIAEVQIHYPFAEVLKDDKNKIKGLPWYEG